MWCGDFDRRFQKGKTLLHNNIINSERVILPGLGLIPQVEDPEASHWRSEEAKLKFCERDEARARNEEELMRELDKEYRKLCRRDKVQFLENTLAQDTWDTRRVFLPNNNKKSKGALNLPREDGVLGESVEREEIMARFQRKRLQ